MVHHAHKNRPVFVAAGKGPLEQKQLKNPFFALNKNLSSYHCYSRPSRCNRTGSPNKYLPFHCGYFLLYADPLFFAMKACYLQSHRYFFQNFYQIYGFIFVTPPDKIPFQSHPIEKPPAFRRLFSTLTICQFHKTK